MSKIRWEEREKGTGRVRERERAPEEQEPVDCLLDSAADVAAEAGPGSELVAAV